MAGKVTKESVSYRRAGLGRKRCATCDMFRAPATRTGPATCTLVAGRIRPGDVCDRWAPKDR